MEITLIEIYSRITSTGFLVSANYNILKDGQNIGTLIIMTWHNDSKGLYYQGYISLNNGKTRWFSTDSVLKVTFTEALEKGNRNIKKML